MDSDAFHTFIGTSAPAMAVLISFSEVEAWLRIASLVLGICIGAVSLYKMLKSKKFYAFTASGSVSNKSHPLLYQFDWKGDGSDLSYFTPSSQSKTWSAPGIDRKSVV
jgi:hypothetical protein